ncbi:MAG: hypothetical protein ACJ735_08870 [Actinomycetes bacterium]
MTDQPGGGSSELMSERMQSLLSRAAEDQASEQRQIQALLTELRDMLGRLPDDVAAAASSTGGEQNVSGQFAQLGQHLGQLGARVDAIAQAVGGRSAEDPGSLAVVGAVQSSTENLLSRFEALSQQVEAIAARPAAPSGGQALAEVSGRVGGVERNMAELGAAMAEIHRRVAALDAAMGPVPGEMRGLVERLEGRIGNRLDSLDDIAAAVQQSNGGAADETVTTQLGEIRAALDSLVDRPSLAEDRETVVLAVRQFLGETVQSAVSETERNVREHVTASLGQALPASEKRSQEQLQATLRIFAGELDQRLNAAVRAATEATEQRVQEQIAELMRTSGGSAEVLEEVRAFNTRADAREQRLREDVADALHTSFAATEHRLTDHIDEAIFALAEALVRKGKPRHPQHPGAPPSAPVLGDTVVDEPPPDPPQTASVPGAEPEAAAPETADTSVAEAPAVEEPTEPETGAEAAAEPTVTPANPWELAPGADETGETDEAPETIVLPEDEPQRRKRGWWRSG